MPRRIIKPQKPLRVHEALELLRCCSRNLLSLNRFNKGQSRQLQDAIEILTQEQESAKRHKYKLFLQDAYSTGQRIGPVLVMLCAIALGQGKIINMNTSSRSMLLSAVKDKSQEFDQPKLHFLASRSGLVLSQQNATQAGDDGEQTQETETRRKIRYMFSGAPTSHIPLLSTLIPDAIQTSRLWVTERLANEPRTGCLTVMIPRDENSDISINLWVGQQAGVRLLQSLDLQSTWPTS